MSQAGELNVVQNHPEIATQYNADVGFAVPIANILEILGGTNVNTEGTGNQIIINATGGGAVTWNRISASQTLANDEGYFCVGGGALLLTLPVISALGSTIKISLDGSTSFQIVQGAGQSIRMGNQQTTAGVTGSLTSTAQGDTIELTCSLADLRWNVISSEGNLTIV